MPRGEPSNRAIPRDSGEHANIGVGPRLVISTWSRRRGRAAGRSTAPFPA